MNLDIVDSQIGLIFIKTSYEPIHHELTDNSDVKIVCNKHSQLKASCTHKYSGALFSFSE